MFSLSLLLMTCFIVQCADPDKALEKAPTQNEVLTNLFQEIFEPDEASLFLSNQKEIEVWSEEIIKGNTHVIKNLPKFLLSCKKEEEVELVAKLYISISLRSFIEHGSRVMQHQNPKENPEKLKLLLTTEAAAFIYGLTVKYENMIFDESEFKKDCAAYSVFQKTLREHKIVLDKQKAIECAKLYLAKQFDRQRKELLENLERKQALIAAGKKQLDELAADNPKLKEIIDAIRTKSDQ